MLDIFRISDNDEMTDELLLKFIQDNDQITANRYQTLWDSYNGEYAIYDEPPKPDWMSDFRTAVNFARVIVDTFEGMFLGIPVRVKSTDERTDEYINTLDKLTDADDINAELSSIVSIFGRGYRIVYVDEDGDIGTAYLDPMESFAIYNQSITPKMRYFVRTYTETLADGTSLRRGSISDDTYVRYFTIDGSNIIWDEAYMHGFAGVPAVEFIQNRARRGIFEDVLPLIDFVNETVSAKMNDINSIAQHIIKILGAKFDTTALQNLRNMHIINVEGKNAADLVVEFLTPPNADASQEHLLDRLERLIFTIAMVCDITNDGFAASSGIAIRWKMTPMINLATNKWRKFEHSLKLYYKLVCSNPVTPLQEDDWISIEFLHQLSYPINMFEEAEMAGVLSGITSRETQLSVLSVVDDPQKELERIKAEAKSDMTALTMPTNRTITEYYKSPSERVKDAKTAVETGGDGNA